MRKISVDNLFNYLDQIDNEKSQTQKYYNKTLKENYNFSKLSLYKYLEPFSIELFKFLKTKNTENKIYKILSNLLLKIYFNLNIGYNNYHIQEKIKNYELARENSSKIQAIFFLLYSLNEINENENNYFQEQINDIIVSIGSLIKSIEKKEDKDD